MSTVVQFPGPPYLRLRQIATRDGTGVITKWLKQYPAARARFRIRVEHLAKFQRDKWTNKQFKHLGGRPLRDQMGGRQTVSCARFRQRRIFHHGSRLHPQGQGLRAIELHYDSVETNEGGTKWLLANR